MGYTHYRWFVHIGALVIGAMSFSWMLLGFCVAAHYFISPAAAADLGVKFDQDDRETALSAHRTVINLTLTSSFFSVVWYFVGSGISMFIQ